jgi:general secretion pathway protein L
MSTLVVLLPPRGRLSAADAPASAPARELVYALSQDGLLVHSSGRCAPSLLPRADTVVAVLADADVAWHRVTVPKAPAGRLRAALGGLLEDGLLDEPEQVHLALSPEADPGSSAWVAVVNRPWLAGELAALERNDRVVDRVVPMSWPDELAQGHFEALDDGATPDSVHLRLIWSDANGVVTMRLQGTLARALLSPEVTQAARFTAAPAVAAQAERWLGLPVSVMSPEERGLQATRSLWNLRQFDLAVRHRGVRALRTAWQRWRTPAWRPVRWGLASLVLLQLVGLNAYAWHQRGELAQRRAAMADLLKQAHPQVPVVVDAAVQMRRETELLRAAAGRSGDDDLEALLQAAAAAWPPGKGPTDALRFEPGRLTLGVAGWSDAEVQQFAGQLAAAGWRLDRSAEARVTLQRPPAPKVAL